MVGAVAKWRCRSGLLRTAGETYEVVLEAFTDVNPALEDGIDRVVFDVAVNGSPHSTITSFLPTLRRPNYSTRNSPIPGIVSGMSPVYAYGTTLDCTALPAGTITVAATVHSNAGTATAVSEVLTVYNQVARPSTKTIYVSPTGNDANDGTSPGAPKRSIMQGVLACRANPAGSSSADRDCGGALLVLMPGDHQWAGGFFGVGNWHTSGAWWLTVSVVEGARIVRPGTTTVVPDHYLTASGNGTGTFCRLRFVLEGSGKQFVGRGGVVNVTTGVRCDVWVDGGRSGSAYHDPSSKPWSVRFHEDSGQIMGFDGDMTNARRFLSCHVKEGCTFGHTGWSDLQDFIVTDFLGVALQSSGSEPGCSALNGIIERQRYTTGVAGWADVSSPNLTVRRIDSHPSNGLPAMEIQATGTVPMDFAAALAELVGTSHWGVSCTGFALQQHNGSYAVLETGYKSGRPYVVLDNRNAVTQSAGASARFFTALVSGGTAYTTVIHPDIHQWNAPSTETVHSNIAARDLADLQTWFSSGHNLTRCVLNNVTDGGTGLRANFTGSSFIGCLFFRCSFSGPWDWSTSGEVFTGTNIVNCVIAQSSSIPTTGVYLRGNHFITGTPLGIDPTSGAWYLTNTAIAPWSFQPQASRLDLGWSNLPVPTEWRWAGSAGTTQGCWSNVGLYNWGTGVIMTGAAPAGINAAAPSGSILTGQIMQGAPPATIALLSPTGTMATEASQPAVMEGAPAPAITLSAPNGELIAGALMSGSPPATVALSAAAGTLIAGALMSASPPATIDLATPQGTMLEGIVMSGSPPATVSLAAPAGTLLTGVGMQGAPPATINVGPPAGQLISGVVEPPQPSAGRRREPLRRPWTPPARNRRPTRSWH